MSIYENRSELFSEKNANSHISKKFYLSWFCIQIPNDIDSLESIRMYFN